MCETYLIVKDMDEAAEIAACVALSLNCLN